MLVSAVYAQVPTPFRFWKPIDRGAAKEEEIVAFTLDSDIYAATRTGVPDLRIVDDSQVEAPYLIEPQVEYRQDQSRQNFDTVILALHKDANSIEVHLRLPKDAPEAEGFSIATPLVNYERKVRVSGSADGMQWTQLATAIIFDYSQYMDVSSREISLPKNTFREFKIAIEDVTDDKESPFKELTRTFKDAKEDQRVERTVIERRPFRIDRIGAWHTITSERVQKAKTVSYPIVSFDAKDDAAKKQTVITVRTRREPITRFVLETTSRNFSRRVMVAVLAPNPVTRPRGFPKPSSPESSWQPIGDATIENVSFRNQKREQLAIAIPERREEQFQIVISNEDNPPLNVTGVLAEGTIQSVIFLAQPARHYRVYYGSETADTPRYEAARVLASLRQENAPVVAKLGAQADNVDFGGEPSQPVRGLLNNWIFLGSASGLMVVVLGWALFRAGRRLEDFPKE